MSPFDDGYLESFAAALRTHKNLECLAPGLTDPEVNAVQEAFGIVFPPDLRAGLQFALPIGGRFPNWREANDADLHRQLDTPFSGIWFDVENCGLWLDEWVQSRPTSNLGFEL